MKLTNETNETDEINQWNQWNHKIILMRHMQIECGSYEWQANHRLLARLRHSLASYPSSRPTQLVSTNSFRPTRFAGTFESGLKTSTSSLLSETVSLLLKARWWVDVEEVATRWNLVICNKKLIWIIFSSVIQKIGLFWLKIKHASSKGLAAEESSVKSNLEVQINFNLIRCPSSVRNIFRFKSTTASICFVRSDAPYFWTVCHKSGKLSR